MASTMLGR